jgi:proton-dependent oligopeptide transporter, POT family
MELLGIVLVGTLTAGWMACRQGDPARGRYRTSPEDTDLMPAGIPYIVANEGAERFSFYGMKAGLIVFMTTYLVGPGGARAPMSEPEAKSVYHLFTAAAYFTPILGALFADWFVGKYRVILALSVVYCLGHLALALDETRAGLLVGLTLISLGAGGIKPLVTAHVADQFGGRNKHRLVTAISWFYWAVNAGGLVAMLTTPWLLEHHGPRVAFAVPGVLMLIGTVIFWMGRHRFVHLPAAGGEFAGALRTEGLAGVRRLLPVLALSSVFWSLYDQNGSAFVLQAQRMDNHILGVEILPAQIQAANPFFILLFIPIFSGVIYPVVGRLVRLSELTRACAGCVLMVACFLLIARVQVAIDLGGRPSIAYHLLAYVLLTAAEVMLSITLIEYTCRHAPPRLKSLAMAGFLLSVSAGNLLTAFVNHVIVRPDGSSRLEGASYFLFFAGLMAATALAFGWLAYRRFDDVPAPPAGPPEMAA